MNWADKSKFFSLTIKAYSDKKYAYDGRGHNSPFPFISLFERKGSGIYNLNKEDEKLIVFETSFEVAI
jgi:hypothetical protein